MDMAMDMDMDTVPVDFKFRKTLSLYIKKLPHKWRNGDLIKTIFERENIGVVAQVDILEQEEEDFAITDRVEKMTYSAAIHFQKWNHNSQTISMQVSLCKYKYTWLYYSDSSYCIIQYYQPPTQRCTKALLGPTQEEQLTQTQEEQLTLTQEEQLTLTQEEQLTLTQEEQPPPCQGCIDLMNGTGGENQLGHACMGY